MLQNATHTTRAEYKVSKDLCLDKNHDDSVVAERLAEVLRQDICNASERGFDSLEVETVQEFDTTGVVSFVEYRFILRK